MELMAPYTKLPLSTITNTSIPSVIGTSSSRAYAMSNKHGRHAAAGKRRRGFLGWESEVMVSAVAMKNYEETNG